MVCKKCGTKNKEEAKFCIKCGEKLTETEKAGQTEENEKPVMQAETEQPSEQLSAAEDAAESADSSNETIPTDTSPKETEFSGNTEAVKTEEKKKNSNYPFWAAVLAAVAVILGGAALALNLNNDDKSIAADASRTAGETSAETSESAVVTETSAPENTTVPQTTTAKSETTVTTVTTEPEKKEKSVKTDKGEITYDIAGDTIKLINYSGNDTSIDISSVIDKICKEENSKLNRSGCIVGKNCFASSDIESINLSAISSIEENAFYSCKKLSSIEELGNVDIGASAFAWCSSLREVTISRTADLGEYAFSDCSNLEKVVFYNTDKLNIGDQCFFNSGLEKVVCYGIRDENALTVSENAFINTPWEWNINSVNGKFDKFALMAYPDKFMGKEYELELNMNSISNGFIEASYDSADFSDIIGLEYDTAKFNYLNDVDLNRNSAHIIAKCVFNGETATVRDYNTLLPTYIPKLEVVSLENEDNLSYHDEANYSQLSDELQSLKNDPDSNAGKSFEFEMDIIRYQAPMVAYGFGYIAGKVPGTDMYIGVNYMEDAVDSNTYLDGTVTVYGEFSEISSSPLDYLFSEDSGYVSGSSQVYEFWAEKITE